MVSNVVNAMSPALNWGQKEDNLLSSLKILSGYQTGQKIQIVNKDSLTIAIEDRYGQFFRRWYNSDGWEPTVLIIDSIMKECFFLSNKARFLSLKEDDLLVGKKISELNGHYQDALKGINLLREFYASPEENEKRAAEQLALNLNANVLTASKIMGWEIEEISDFEPPAAPPLLVTQNAYVIDRELITPNSRESEPIPIPTRNRGSITNSASQVADGIFNLTPPNSPRKKIRKTGESGVEQFKPSLLDLKNITLKAAPRPGALKRSHEENNIFRHTTDKARHQLPQSVITQRYVPPRSVQFPSSFSFSETSPNPLSGEEFERMKCNLSKPVVTYIQSRHTRKESDDGEDWSL